MSPRSEPAAGRKPGSPGRRLQRWISRWRPRRSSMPQHGHDSHAMKKACLCGAHATETLRFMSPARGEGISAGSRPGLMANAARSRRSALGRSTTSKASPEGAAAILGRRPAVRKTASPVSSTTSTNAWPPASPACAIRTRPRAGAKSGVLGGVSPCKTSRASSSRHIMSRHRPSRRSDQTTVGVSPPWTAGVSMRAAVASSICSTPSSVGLTRTSAGRRDVKARLQPPALLPSRKRVFCRRVNGLMNSPSTSAIVLTAASHPSATAAAEHSYPSGMV